MKHSFPIIQEPPALTVPALKKSCIIFDLDGVLADSPQLPRLDWNDVELCERLMTGHRPHWPMISIANFFYNNGGANIAIVVMTGRPERYRAVTTEWLIRHKIKYHDLWMREDNDARHDHQIKREMLSKIRRALNVWFAVEDRNNVVEMWRKEGVLCLQPQEGDY